MSSFPDRLAAARRFAQLYAGGWTQAEAAKLAGAEAARVRQTMLTGAASEAGGTWARPQGVRAGAGPSCTLTDVERGQTGE